MNDERKKRSIACGSQYRWRLQDRPWKYLNPKLEIPNKGGNT